MKTLKTLILFLMVTEICNAQNKLTPALTAQTDTFNNVLKLAKMSFVMPKDAIPILKVKNRQMHYEYAVTFKDTPFEIRYAVTATGYTVAESYKGDKGKISEALKSQDDDLMQKTTMTVIAMNVAGGVPNPKIGNKEFPKDAVKKDFNADWGYSTIIELQNNSFGTEYKFCLMTTIHKKDAGTGYVFYLGKDQESVFNYLKTIIASQGSFTAMKFL